VTPSPKSSSSKTAVGPATAKEVPPLTVEIEYFMSLVPLKKYQVYGPPGGSLGAKEPSKPL
jgi:hypothetical protein